MSSPFSTPKKQKPNPHPYAIKTTSTALLSRNSSSSSTASSIHHYVPPSPSPTRTGETRYPSTESPRPLPAPPSPAVLLTGGFKGDDDTPCRVQRAYSLPQDIKLPQDPKQWTPAEVSIYLSSSLNAAAAAGGHNLSTSAARDIVTFVKDKKITGKSFLRLNEADLEEYGINQLWRNTLLNASRALRWNVLHGRIWGNSTEHDYGDNDDNSLSSNSSFVITNRKRSLSTTSETRVRVRDMIDTLERSSSASSSELYEGSGTDGKRNKDTRSNRDKIHHRYRSLEQHRHQQLQLQQQGRLPQRGNVSTLFGTSAPAPDTPEQEIVGKDSTITAHARKNVNGNEPRLLPFPPTGPKTSNSVNHQYEHIVTPSHTGTFHPLPPSPLDHARNPQTTPYYLDSNLLNTQPSHHQPLLFPSHSQALNTFDYYELGFKNSLPLSSSPPIGPIRSPNSQRYVVQHNNAQPSSSSSSFAPGGVGGHSTGGGRLLPYPPIMGEAELFHPKPRIGTGVGGLVGGLEDKLEVGGEETVYYSASETQPESADSEEEGSATKTSESESENENKIEIGFGSNATDVVEPPEKAKEGDEQERDFQNLLLIQSQFRPRTISEALEMGLGDTAKRISSNGSIISAGGTKTRTRPRKRDPVMGEIGRKSGKMSDVDDLLQGERKKTTGVLNPEVVEAPDSVAGGVESDGYDDKGLKTSLPLPDTSPSTSNSHQSTLDERDIQQREVEVQKRVAEIEKREQEVSEREVRVERREVEVQKREAEIEKREQDVSEREVRIERREVEVKEWYRAKLNEIEVEEASVDVPPPIPASTWIRIAESKWPSSPLEFARRLFATFVLPVLGKERTPGFLLPSNGVASCNSFTTTSSSTITPLTSTSLPTSITKASSALFWSHPFLKRLLGATAGGDSYIVLVSIGICVISLRGVVRRVLRIGGFRRPFEDFRGFGGL